MTTDRRGFLRSAGSGASLALAHPATVLALAGDAQQRLRAIIRENGTRGVSDGVVLIARDGALVLRQAFGLADRERGAASRPDGVFRIGSVTKQFTAAAILLLVQDGTLSLDQSMTSIFSDAPKAWAPITIRHLLRHRSGLANFTELATPEKEQWSGKSVEDVIDLIRDLPLTSAPGQGFAYDNTGYVMLGGIVARASGATFASFLGRRVFAPLNMHNTGFVCETPPRGAASGYIRNGSTWRKARWMSAVRESGAGAMFSTVDDLLRWDRGLHGGKLLGPVALQSMFTDHGDGFGFGYVIGVQDGRRVWWHNGHTEGFSAMLARFPDDRLTIIVLSNDEGARVERLSRDLAAACLATHAAAPQAQAI